MRTNKSCDKNVVAKLSRRNESVEITWITVFDPIKASIFFQSRSNLQKSENRESIQSAFNN